MDTYPEEEKIPAIKSPAGIALGASQSSVPPSLSLEIKNSLKKLKTTILSIDWEITEVGLAELIQETNRLITKFPTDPSVQALLRILKTMGKYIRKHKARSHPEAIKLVMSAFASLEKIVVDQPLPEAVKKRLAGVEVNSFKNLRTILGIPIAAPSTDGPAAAKPKDGAQVVPPDFKQALAEVENRFNAQLAQLKIQIDHLQRQVSVLVKNR